MFETSKTASDHVDILAVKIGEAVAEQKNFYRTEKPMLDGKEISPEQWKKMIAGLTTANNKKQLHGQLAALTRQANDKGFVYIEIKGERFQVKINSQEELDKVQELVIQQLTKKAEGQTLFFKTTSELKDATDPTNTKKLTDKEAKALIDKIPTAVQGAAEGELDLPGVQFNLLSLEKAVIGKKQTLSEDDKKRIAEIEKTQDLIKQFMDKREKEQSAPPPRKESLPPVQKASGPDIDAIFDDITVVKNPSLEKNSSSMAFNVASMPRGIADVQSPSALSSINQSGLVQSTAGHAA